MVFSISHRLASLAFDKRFVTPRAHATFLGSWFYSECEGQTGKKVELGMRLATPSVRLAARILRLTIKEPTKNMLSIVFVPQSGL